METKDTWQWYWYWAPSSERHSCDAGIIYNSITANVLHFCSCVNSRFNFGSASVVPCHDQANGARGSWGCGFAWFSLALFDLTVPEYSSWGGKFHFREQQSIAAFVRSVRVIFTTPVVFILSGCSLIKTMLLHLYCTSRCADSGSVCLVLIAPICFCSIKRKLETKIMHYASFEKKKKYMDLLFVFVELICTLSLPEKSKRVLVWYMQIIKLWPQGRKISGVSNVWGCRGLPFPFFFFSILFLPSPFSFFFVFLLFQIFLITFFWTWLSEYPALSLIFFELNRCKDASKTHLYQKVDLLKFPRWFLFWNYNSIIWSHS